MVKAGYGTFIMFQVHTWFELQPQLLSLNELGYVGFHFLKVPSFIGWLCSFFVEPSNDTIVKEYLENLFFFFLGHQKLCKGSGLQCVDRKAIKRSNYVHKK